MRPPFATRLVGAGAALATTGLLTAALLGLFHGVSREPWLVATPELMADLAACEARQEGIARHRCEQQVVAARRSQEPRAQVVAAVP